MARGGARPGAGRPKQHPLADALAVLAGSPGKGKAVDADGGMDAVTYLRSVVADPAAPPERRFRASLALLPFEQRRPVAPEYVSKKEQDLETARQRTSEGVFQPPPPPRLTVVDKAS